MFDDAFRPLGLNNFQFSLLMLLNRPISPTIGGLAADLSMDRTTITANLKPLERRGLLAVRRDSKDARIKLVALTAAGRTLLAECISRWQAANASDARNSGQAQSAVILFGPRSHRRELFMNALANDMLPIDIR
jgi:DNA-binding MarR family transcriptional regulator